MGKFMPRIYRADSMQDHRHAMPDGSFTGGMVAKPAKDMAMMHSHLYELDDGRVMETAPAHNFGDHIHTTEEGDTSGPAPMDKKPGDEWKPEPKIANS